MKVHDFKIEFRTLFHIFEKSADIRFEAFEFHSRSVYFITCDGMVDAKSMEQVIIPRVQSLFDTADFVTEEDVRASLHLPFLYVPQTKEELITRIYNGHAGVYFEELQLIVTANIESKPNRSPEETRLEVPVKGPRDNFIEDITVNIALLRKRLPTNSLCVEKFEVGARSKTTVALLYFDDIANEDTLAQLRSQLVQVDTDIVFSGDALMEFINKRTWLFPRSDFTGRPDTAIQTLARGRFLIMVDGVAYATITPISLFLLMKTSEDNELPSIQGSFQRLLRTASLLIGLLLPAFWLALTTFHQNQLPLQLLATVVQANLGLPFPSAFEMLVMLGLFELFREAGLRLPTVLGSTIGVVGGLIIGDAAIRAGLTSPAMIVIIATSTIATYTLVNQSLVTAINVLRIFFITLTSAFGLFGFYMSLFSTLLYLSTIHVFGVPYLNISADISRENIKKTLFRLPADQYVTRPNILKPKDPTRGKGKKK